MYLFIGGMVFVYKSHTGFTQERNDYFFLKKSKRITKLCLKVDKTGNSPALHC